MSTATETPGVNPVPGVAPGIDPVEVAAERRYRPNPAEVQRLAPNRDERLFLVLSIFIGVISGLMVVCFRVAISWIQVLTLGSSPHPGQLPAIFCTHGRGAGGGGPGSACLSRGPRQRHQPDQGSALHLQRLHLFPNGDGEIYHRGDWPSVVDSRLDPRTLRFRLERVWPPWSAVA